MIMQVDPLFRFFSNKSLLLFWLSRNPSYLTYGNDYSSFQNMHNICISNYTAELPAKSDCPYNVLPTNVSFLSQDAQFLLSQSHAIIRFSQTVLTLHQEPILSFPQFLISDILHHSP